MQEQQTLIPALRFPEFIDSPEWQVKLLGEVLMEAKIGGNYSSQLNTRGLPLIKMGNISRGFINLEKIEFVSFDNEINSNDLLVEGDLLLNTRNTLELVGKVAIWRSELDNTLYNSNILRLSFLKDAVFSNYFLNYLLNTQSSIKNLRQIATGTTSVAAIYTKDLIKIPIPLPSLPEQEKIANFLTSFDELIHSVEKECQLLETYKKGLLQKIFSQEIRFKDEHGNDFPEWQEVLLGEVMEKRKEKNLHYLFDKKDVLSVTAEYGLVNQIDYLGRSYAGEDLKNYKVVKLGDVVYTKSPLKDFPYGIIKSNLFKQGIVSTLYDIFKVNSLIDSRLINFFFSEKAITNNALAPLVQKGAKNTLALTSDLFLSIPIPLPSLPEQEKIANFLSSVDTQIEAKKKQLQALQQYKKGLLQQLFPTLSALN